VAIIKDILLTIQALISLALVIVVATQTTKNEGLTGNIGGPVTSSFKGKPGMEEQIRRITIYVCVAWFAISLLTAGVFTAASIHH
jgi:preprotein translocase subunit SecG